jgi:hypothetical protein
MLDRILSLLRVNRKLILGKNATMVVTNADNTETTVNILELAALDGIGAADLAKIDGITNGTGAASKALVLDSSGNVAMPATGAIGLSRAALAAAGTDATNGGSIATQVVAVTASDGTKGVVLPAAATTTGPIYIINTVLTSGADLKVYPVNGGNDQINGEAEDAAFTMGPGAAAWFVPTSATQWYVSDKAGVLTTKAEDNILDGVTATAAELNYNDIATLGTLAASKAWTSDASLDTVMPTGGLLTVQSGGAVTMNSGSTLTLSGGVVQAPVFVADATPYTVLAADSGKLHIILEQTSSITLNLPVIAAGLSYKFVMGGVATEAQNWVIVATTPSFYNGGIAWTDLNDTESNLAVVYANGTSHLTLTVTTPAAGTGLEIYSNGTEWFVHGTVISDSTPAFT